MGRSISLIFLLPYIFLLSVDLFGANLRANAVTQLIQKVCDYSTVQDFCYNVFANDFAQRAKTKYNIEDVAIQLAYSNYTIIHRNVWNITSNETNPEFKHIYRKCLHQYLLLKSDLENLIDVLILEGNLDEAAQRATDHLNVCVGYFYQYPNIPNPFAKDNEHLAYFFELIRDIYFTPL
ncbi:hypothetical protein RND71_025623 [Anisodus tanguticus]|uniref:Pectinesterase inhibitor domain-containing protein n=1 Tax=Anisodus tanguticus TaxID=243964 RepID=A0AAE1RSM2_9SOLA|nr:hypothetical protein RND71_025623 [Anisodus tanguticus]